MTVKPYNFQEKVDFLEDLIKNHESQQILIHEEHDHLSGCTLFGMHSNYSTSVDLTLGILNGGIDVDKKNFSEPDMTKIIIGDENVGLYFKILSPYRHLFFDYLKDGELLRKRRMDDLVTSSSNYFDISYVSALKLLKHEEKIPLEFIAEFDKYKMKLIMEIEDELQLISGMERDLHRKLENFEDRIVAKLVANRIRSELEYKKHDVKR